MDEQIQQLSKAESRRLRNERKRERREAEQRKEKMKKLVKRVRWVIVGAAILVSLVFLVSNQKVLPPTSRQGHIERSPESHILTMPMDTRIHSHMLEHSDGSGPPGIIINYNCNDFDCELGLLDNLVKLVEEYPKNVYVAPFRNMSAKLVLSAEGRQEIFDGFDEQKIRNFIEQ